MAKPDGGSAFPYPRERVGDEVHGMSLRDYFAAQWLLVASEHWAHTDAKKLATEAYVMADAMLQERVK